MVVLLDLDEGGCDDPFIERGAPVGFASSKLLVNGSVTKTPNSTTVQIERPNPNLNGVSAALGCYPIVTQLAHHIDLNTLHALSQTCRQIHANLLQYRHQLIRQTLRCSNEYPSTCYVSGDQLKDAKPHFLSSPTTLTSGRVSPCARDLVSDCRSCGLIICRVNSPHSPQHLPQYVPFLPLSLHPEPIPPNSPQNCTHKPPSPSHLPSRLRRLCPACLAAPLPLLTTRSPCTCPTATYLCHPCGTPLSSSDTTYSRVWTWRTSYSKLGTGIGEGNEGVKCWRGEACLSAQDVEVEVECSETGEEEEVAGYWRQEVEGIGGVVRRKVRRRGRVGGTVREWEDEREQQDETLGREKRGRERAWCGWCGRVVLGVCDLEEGEGCKASCG